MKKRFFISMVALSLAGGLLAFGQGNSGNMANEHSPDCAEECCGGDAGDDNKCCADTEMCCE